MFGTLQFGQVKNRQACIMIVFTNNMHLIVAYCVVHCTSAISQIKPQLPK